MTKEYCQFVRCTISWLFVLSINNWFEQYVDIKIKYIVILSFTSILNAQPGYFVKYRIQRCRNFCKQIQLWNCLNDLELYHTANWYRGYYNESHNFYKINTRNS
jgi:hypothetical protein